MSRLGCVVRRACALWSLAVTFVLLAVLAPPAAAENTVTVFDHLPGSAFDGQSQTYTGAEVFVVDYGRVNDVFVTARDERGDFDVHIGSGVAGEPLRVGLQPLVNEPFEASVGPSLRVTSGCGAPWGGYYEIRDIAYSPAGIVERLWLIYEYRCAGGGSSRFGEVRIGQPSWTGPVQLASRHVRWPAIDLGEEPFEIRHDVTFSSAGTIASIVLTGEDPQAFGVVDDCVGREFAAGESCSLWLWRVAAAGTRRARVRITTTTGLVRELPLEAFTYGGQTRFEVHSEAGDPIGGGDRTYERPASWVRGLGYGREASMSGFDLQTGASLGVLLVVPVARPFAPGVFPGATRAPFNGAGAGMGLVAGNLGCNELDGSFVVREARFDGMGELRTLGATFEGQCRESDHGPISGSMSFREGDTTELPPWMGSSGPTPGGSAPEAPASGAPALPAPILGPDAPLAPSSVMAPAAPPRDRRARPRLLGSARGLTVRRDGTVRLLFGCARGGARCAGTVSIAAGGAATRWARGRFSIAAGTTRSVALRLSHTALRALRRGRRPVTVRLRGTFAPITVRTTLRRAGPLASAADPRR